MAGYAPPTAQVHGYVLRDEKTIGQLFVGFLGRVFLGKVRAVGS